MMIQIKPLRLSRGLRFLSSTQATHGWDYDVFICGGGAVGALFANQLLKLTEGSIRIGILEQKEPQPIEEYLKSPPDIRVYALSPKSISLIRGVDAWKTMESRAQPYTRMQVWEAKGPGVVAFSAQDCNVPELGSVVEDRVLQAALFESLRNSPYKASVDLLFGGSVVDLTVQSSENTMVGPAKVSFQLKDRDQKTDRSITARLVVGADGAQSAVRRLSGIPMWGWGYGQEAVVATVKVKSDPRHWDAANRTAWQRYLPTGPLALLPLWGDLCSIVWSLPMLEARRVRSLSEADFLQELNQALAGDMEVGGNNRSQASSSASSFSSPSISESISDLIAAVRDRSVGGLLGVGTQLLAKPVGFIANEVNALVSTATSAALISNPPRPPHEVVGIESARFSFPLQLQQAHRYFSPRVALVGDSAHSIHPQAGQGLNMGLQDANDLATVLAEAINSGADFGLPGTLQKYSDLAKPRNLKMLGVVDTVHRLFGAGGDSILMRDDSPALGELPKTLRSLGMLGIHSSAPLRQRLAKYAMGL